MAIKFHCEHCGKTISAPDNAGGKRGRCPACEAVVYIPSPAAEELDLAPIDEEEERRRRRLIEQDLAAEHDLLVAQGRREPPGDDAEPAPETERGEGGIALPEIDGGEAPGLGGNPRDLLVDYLLCMAAGRLEGADSVVRRLQADPAAARAAVDEFIGDPLTDSRIAEMPAPVVNGLLNQLMQQLK